MKPIAQWRPLPRLLATLLLLASGTTPSTAQVVINEFMFDPVTLDEESSAEYVELLNTGPAAVAVAGWKLFDRSERAQATIPTTVRPLQPGAYLVIASDSTIYRIFPALRDSSNVVVINRASFSLNLAGDEVRIRDADGKLIDSVAYISGWHWSELAGTRGIALERISWSAASTDARNWSSCVAPTGGTPGAVNSRSLGMRQSHATLAATPDIISPDSDGHDDFCRISWQIPRSASLVTITIYDRHGRLMTSILDHQPAPAEGETIWNGTNERGEPLPPGIYLLLLEAYDGSGAEMVVAKGKVIVAG